MLGHRQLHRQTSKDKISAALRTVWERRIVSVRSRQKVLQIWSNSIAEAAKNGGHGQDMLGWDSYERIKSEMVSTFLWIKERGRMVKKLERAVAKIAAKRLQVVRRREEQATRMKKLKPDCQTLLQNADRQPARVVVSARPKLKERLAKWHGRKKELETVISSRARKRGLRNPPRRQMTAESLEALSTSAAGAP